MLSSAFRTAAQSARRQLSHVPRVSLNQPSRRPLSSRPEFDLPFKPPPISARLRPLIPFFIYWCAITSLAVHLLRNRTSSREELDKTSAQISVLSGLIARLKAGEKVSGDEVQRELEMVGLRERCLTIAQEGEGGDVGWLKAIFGRRGVQDEDEVDEKKVEEDAVQEWAKVVNEATTTSSVPSTPSAPERIGTARRAPSSTVYM